MPTDLSNLEGARIQEPGIRGLRGAWIQSRAEELGSLDGEALKEKFLSLRKQLSALEGMDANFADGLVGILDNQFSPLGEKETREDRIHSREALLQWFEGGRKCPCSTAIMPASGEICASTACTTFPAANRQAPARKLTHLHARAYRWQPPLEEINRELFQRLDVMKNEEKALMNRPWLDFLATFSAQAGHSPP